MPTECSAEQFDFGMVEGRAFETALGPNPQRPCFVCLGATTLGKNDVRGGLRRLPCERIISFPKLMRIESNLDVD